MQKIAVFMVIALLQVTGVTSAQPISSDSIFKNGARNNYEALDFGSPESTTGALLSAWMRRDYLTVHMTLSYKAQRGFQDQILVNFSLKSLFPSLPEKGETFVFSAFDDKTRLPDEVLSSYSLFFDWILLSAEQFDALPFKLGAEPTIVANSTNGETATISVETGGTPEKIILSLVAVDKIHWKVDSITLPKSNHALQPWGF